jgi:hypothetical protein
MPVARAGQWNLVLVATLGPADACWTTARPRPLHGRVGAVTPRISRQVKCDPVKATSRAIVGITSPTRRTSAHVLVVPSLPLP